MQQFGASAHGSVLT